MFSCINSVYELLLDCKLWLVLKILISHCANYKQCAEVCKQCNVMHNAFQTCMAASIVPIKTFSSILINAYLTLPMLALYSVMPQIVAMCYNGYSFEHLKFTC